MKQHCKRPTCTGEAKQYIAVNSAHQKIHATDTVLLLLVQCLETFILRIELQSGLNEEQEFRLDFEHRPSCSRAPVVQPLWYKVILFDYPKCLYLFSNFFIFLKCEHLVFKRGVGSFP